MADTSDSITHQILEQCDEDYYILIRQRKPEYARLQTEIPAVPTWAALRQLTETLTQSRQVALKVASLLFVTKHPAHGQQMHLYRGRQVMLDSEKSPNLKRQCDCESPKQGCFWHWITHCTLTLVQSFHPWIPALKIHTVLQLGISMQWWVQ